MPNARLSISALVIFALMLLLGLYFAFAAVQGPSGILRRVQLVSETRELEAERDRLKGEVDAMANLTRRLSDDYLDLDLLDQQAREVLGMVRADEVVTPQSAAAAGNQGGNAAAATLPHPNLPAADATHNTR